MSYEITHTEGENFIRVKAYGRALKSEVPLVEAEILALREERGVVRVLFDHRELESFFGILDLYEVGNRISASKLRRVGVIVNAITEEYRFLETVVANRGGNLRAFTSEEVALAWLADSAGNVEHQDTNSGK
ncbi:MAG: hypothetical protein JSW03_10725 [Candidatus Eiseniibacteriota bacterium]|nr:MAG: hypothetical protein JSW03_10725 [Candidatus Eisenbacteria bacterium]